MPGTIEADGWGAPARLHTRRPVSRRTPPAAGGLSQRWPPSNRARVVVTTLATVAFWAAAAVSWTLACLRAAGEKSKLAWDLVTSWRAEVVFAHGGEPYSRAATDHRLFLYPPSSLLVDRPLALLSLHQVQIFGLVATAVLAWAAVMLSSAALGRRWWGLTSAVVVFALSFAEPTTAELGLANVTVVCMLALAAFYLFSVKGLWIPAAVVIGLTLAVKPLLLPVLLVFALARKWRPLALALVIPAVLNGIAFAVVKDPGAVFSKLPSLLDRSGSGAFLNSAWVDVMQSFGAPHAVTILVRLATAALAVVAAWWSWTLLEDAAVRIITTTSVLLIGTYLAGTLSENHFMLTLVPLAMTVVVGGAPMRWVTAWVGVLLFMGLTPPGRAIGLGTGANLSAFRAFGMVLVLITIVAALGVEWRRRRRPADAGTGPGAGGHQPSATGEVLGARQLGAGGQVAVP